MAFRFRLKPLLRHREHKLREAQSEFAAAESLKRGIQMRVDHLCELMRCETEKFEEVQETGIDIGSYIHFKCYLSNLERELLQLRCELAKALSEVEVRQQIMVECNKSVKVLENMESRERDMYKYLQSRKDQKKLDEVAGFRDYRDRGSDGRREEQ